MRITLTLSVLLWLLAGCQNDEFTDLKTFMAESGHETRQPVEPIPPARPVEKIVYESGALPDPFNTGNIKSPVPVTRYRPDAGRNKEFLERFPLDGLRMVGSLTRGNTLFALVKTPDGGLYRVQKGNHLGQNNGVVTRVTELGIELKEVVLDASGSWVETKAAMALQE